MRVMRHATATAATPVMRARMMAVLDPESSRSTTPGTANSAVPSTTMRARSVTDELDIAALPERAHRRVHDRGGEQQVRDRPERVEDPAVGVGAVGDEPRVDGVGDQHECQPARRATTRRRSTGAA